MLPSLQVFPGHGIGTGQRGGQVQQGPRNHIKDGVPIADPDFLILHQVPVPLQRGLYRKQQHLSPGNRFRITEGRTQYENQRIQHYDSQKQQQDINHSVEYPVIYFRLTQLFCFHPFLPLSSEQARFCCLLGNRIRKHQDNRIHDRIK